MSFNAAISVFVTFRIGLIKGHNYTCAIYGKDQHNMDFVFYKGRDFSCTELLKLICLCVVQPEVAVIPQQARDSDLPLHIVLNSLWGGNTLACPPPSDSLLCFERVFVVYWKKSTMQNYLMLYKKCSPLFH